MWYSGSDRDGNELHRIGYAESKDGVDWERLDEPVPSPLGPEGYFSVPAVLRDASGEVLRQEFERGGPRKGHILGSVYDPHTAFAKLADDFVGPDNFPDERILASH